MQYMQESNCFKLMCGTNNVLYFGRSTCAILRSTERSSYD